MNWLLFFILSLGVARVTWFITEDHLPLVEKPRDWIVGRNPEGSLAYLVNCWFCASVYVAAGASAFSVWVLEADLVFWGNMSSDDFVHSPDDWKIFLLLWPAFSFAAVAIMGAVNLLTKD